MIDDEIKSHVLARIAAAYSAVDSDSYIVKIVQGTASVSGVTNRRDDSGKYAVYETTVTVVVQIMSESKLNRDDLIRQFPRKYIEMEGVKVLQAYQRWLDSDLVEVIGAKGVMHYIDYTYIVYES